MIYLQRWGKIVSNEFGNNKNKLFYYRWLKEYQNKTKKEYLIDMCLNAQD